PSRHATTEATASLDRGSCFTATSDCWGPCSGDRWHMTNSTSTPAQPTPGPSTDRRSRRSSRMAPRVLRAGAIAACTPYIGLKIAWMLGSHIGIPDGSTLLEDRTAMIVGSVESALLD